MTKDLIFDAGPIINFAMNGLLPLFKKIKKEFKGDFLITKEVKQEIIDTPMEIKRFELEALQIKELFDEKIIKHADITEKEVDELRNKREEIMRIANSTFFTNKRSIHILDKGECAALALSSILKSENVIVIDERTTRMLCENPENLRRLFEKKLHTKVNANTKNYEFFRKFKIIRSTELAYIANKKGLLEIKDPKTLEAILYGLKFRGCSISEEEIDKMKKM
jgi:predicted nucleic acid-binding protein